MCPIDFCDFRHTEQLDVLKHMDNDCQKKSPNWRRPQTAVKHNLPPLPTTGCGHAVCLDCANISILTAPPVALCITCGRVASVIKMRDPNDVEKIKPAVPELWTATSLKDHLKQR